jgi:CheY-like chemotaxis protein
MKKKILIAGDDFTNIKKLGNYFSENNFTVLVAITTEQAIKISKEKIPDIILSAFLTPAINGIEIQKSLGRKSQTANIPIFFISEKKNQTLLETAFPNGNNYLLPPYSSEKLLNKINQLISNGSNKNNKVSKNTIVTIMVVDDIEINRNLIEDLLNNGSYKILKSASGKDSIKKIEEKKIDLILLDIEMPIMNGWQTIEHYKKMKLKIPVLAMSAHGNKDFEEKCKVTGFSGIVPKPINRMQLYNSLKKTLKQHPTPKDNETKTTIIKKNKLNYIDIGNLLKVAGKDTLLQISTYKKFLKNVTALYKLFKNENSITSDNELFRKELHTFINLSNYFCTSEIVKKAKNMELELKNNVAHFEEKKADFTLLLGNIKSQLKEVKLPS